MYERRYCRGVLHSGKRSEIANDGTTHTVTRDVDYSLVQEGFLDRNVEGGRGRRGRGRGSGRGSCSNTGRGVGKGCGSRRGPVSCEGFGHSQSRVEHRRALVDDVVYATIPHVRRQSLN